MTSSRRLRRRLHVCEKRQTNNWRQLDTHFVQIKQQKIPLKKVLVTARKKIRFATHVLPTELFSMFVACGKFHTRAGDEIPKTSK